MTKDFLDAVYIPAAPADIISLVSSFKVKRKQNIWVSSEVVNKTAVPQGDQQKLETNFILIINNLVSYLAIKTLLIQWIIKILRNEFYKENLYESITCSRWKIAAPRIGRNGRPWQPKNFSWSRCKQTCHLSLFFTVYWKNCNDTNFYNILFFTYIDHYPQFY